MSACFDSINSFAKVWNPFTVADERSGILAWLSPLEPRIRHQAIRANRVPNVGDWLLQTEVFQTWSGASRPDKSALFYYGDPGVGKTYVTSLVIDTLGDRASEGNIAAACFYFDFFAREEQSPANVLGALLKQVVGGLEVVPEEVVKVYHRQKGLVGGRGPRLPELVKMLQTVSSSQCTFICVDALDECTEEYQPDVLNSLRRVLEGSPSTRLFLTGRAHIRDMVERCFYGRVAIACIGPSGWDIAEYLRARLGKDATPNAMDSCLEAEIIKFIPKSAPEMFLLVSLNIGAILQESTIHRRRQKLNAMTDGLGLRDVYGATVERVRAQGGVKAKLGMAALMWISHSERLLGVDELCHAVAVEIGSGDLDPKNVPSIGTLSHCCLGLLAVDGAASTVRLIHLTLQEYLASHPDFFYRAHSTIAETCLTYLNFQRFKGLPISDLSDPVRTAFLGYSSIYWGTHAKRELSDCAKSLALKLYDDYADHISVKLLLRKVLGPNHFSDIRSFSSFTGLHCASFFGIDDVVAALVRANGCDINQIDCVGNTPLIWAAAGGHEGVVELLLEREDTKPDRPDEYGRTPLSRAAESGHEGAANLLLRQGNVDPNRPDDWGQTPLSWAAKNGHDGLVRLLLIRKDVDPDRPGFDGRAPLSWAAGWGREGVVRLLLEQCDVNPDLPDHEGLAPLSWAVKNGQEGVVKLLLERNDVNPDRPDTIFGQTPLSSAAENGHEGVVKLLLERSDVEPDRPDAVLGHTPLLRAAEKGHEEVVKLLLERKDVNPDRQAYDGRTPLLGAARNGHEGVVKLLLGRGDVDPNKLDTEGRTPLSWAARNGYEGVVKLLLGWEVINPDMPDNDGQTPLSWAVRNGHEGVVKLLMAQENVDSDRPDTEGQTPSPGTAKTGDERVPNLPQKRKDVSPDIPDRSSRTPPPPYATNRKRARLAL